MGPSRRNSLSDDWEDVGDDNLSVISLPVSDDEPADTSTQQKATHQLVHRPKEPSQPTVTPIHAAPPTSFPSIAEEFTPTPTFGGNKQHCNAPPKEKNRALETSVALNNGEEDAEDTQRSAIFPADVTDIAIEKSSRDEDKPYAYEAGSEGTSEEQVNELLDSHDVNPEFILKTLESLGGIIDDVTQTVQDNVNAAFILSRAPIVYGLRNQVNQLKPIISTYAQIWYGTSQDLPLDPGLHEWLSGGRAQMISLNAELQLAGKAERYGRVGAGRAEGYGRVGETLLLDRVWQNLQEYQTQMMAFLPIMQVYVALRISSC